MSGGTSTSNIYDLLPNMSDSMINKFKTDMFRDLGIEIEFKDNPLFNNPLLDKNIDWRGAKERKEIVPLAKHMCDGELCQNLKSAFKLLKRLVVSMAVYDVNQNGQDVEIEREKLFQADFQVAVKKYKDLCHDKAFNSSGKPSRAQWDIIHFCRKFSSIADFDGIDQMVTGAYGGHLKEFQKEFLPIVEKIYRQIENM